MTIHLLALVSSLLFGTRNMEWLDRGLVAVNTSGSNVFLSWRLLGTDPGTIAFNIYRDGTKITTIAAGKPTNYTDSSGSPTAKYSVRAVVGGVEQAADTTIAPWKKQWLSIPLSAPAGGTLNGAAYTYTAGDASAADLDGDGQYEIILRWDPTNAKDNSQSGYTGDVYYDAYKLDGKRLWRIDMGRNIRAGAHYDQFQAYDYDGDGKAELVVKTAPGTKDGTGAYLSKGPAATDTNTADYRNSNGYILTGPEYLTVFNGETGKEMATVNYLPARGNVSAWGDAYGNRVDRFLAATAWLDGVHPSAVFQRGYYTRMAVTAWDWDGTNLVKKWAYDAATSGKECYGQGNHNLSVGDVDGDGKDEVIEGACAIDHDGTFKYRTGLGHGDAMHLGKMNPDNDTLMVWEVHEDSAESIKDAYELHNASTGKIVWGVGVPGGPDNGRGLAADIDSTSPGYEMWSSASDSVFTCKGKVLAASGKPSVNFRVYWDGDLYDELLDGTKLDKWNGKGTTRLFTLYNYPSGDGVKSINGTKAVPCLVADLFGDWREEIVEPTANDDSLIIFTTTIPTPHRMYTLMHDPVYRAAVAWQNSAYNQPPHLGFLLSDTAKWPVADIKLIGAPATSGLRTTAQSVRMAQGPFLQLVDGGKVALPLYFPTGIKLEVRDLQGRHVAYGVSTDDALQFDRTLSSAVRVIVPLNGL